MKAITFSPLVALSLILIGGCNSSNQKNGSSQATEVICSANDGDKDACDKASKDCAWNGSNKKCEKAKGIQLNSEVITAIGNPQPMAVGVMHVCVINGADGKAECSGISQDGSVSNPSKKELKAIVAGDRYTCGITEDNKLDCFGHNPPIMPQGVPTHKVKDISIGTQGTCTIKENNQLECIGGGWLQNGLLRLTGKEAIAVSVGFQFACYLDFNRKAACMATDQSNDHKLNNFLPAERLRQLAVGDGAWACGLKETGEVICFGEDKIDPPASLKAKYIVAGSSHACAIKMDGTVICWGKDTLGRLNAPVDKAIYLAAGGAQSCLVKQSDHKAVCWGKYTDPEGDLIPPPPVTVK